MGNAGNDSGVRGKLGQGIDYAVRALDNFGTSLRIVENADLSNAVILLIDPLSGLFADRVTDFIVADEQADIGGLGVDVPRR